jgi:phage baseplate assembly protein W
MPVERVSKAFKDIGSSLQINPINRDVITIQNETAIARSIRNLLFTEPGERFFNPNLGSRVSKILFESLDDISASLLKNEIEETINNYEPRVLLIDVTVNPDYDNNEFNVVIKYQIVGIDVSPQQLAFALQPTR